MFRHIFACIVHILSIPATWTYPTAEFKQESRDYLKHHYNIVYVRIIMFRKYEIRYDKNNIDKYMVSAHYLHNNFRSSYFSHFVLIAGSNIFKNHT